ncbi:MAG: hypothetical protein MJ068_03535 [Clostridia bacterium]|nr:hypothetical protein [Clostridia bacterium]
MDNKTKYQPNSQPVQRMPKTLRLASWYTDAPVREEPVEEQKIIVAGLAEARPVKDYPEGAPFKRATAVLRGEFPTLFKASLWALVFTLPFIVIVAWFAGYFENLVLGGLYNFMNGIGVGYNPGELDSISVSVASLYWDVKLPVYLMVAAALLFGSIGLAGQFYCCKRSYYQDYYKKITKTYWMGFTKYLPKYLICALFEVIIGSALTISIMYFLKQQVLGLVTAGTYCVPIFTWIFGAPLLMLPMVMMSLFTTYELTFVQTFKNAVVIIVNSPVSVAFIGIVSAAPLLLCLSGNIFAIIVYLAMVLIGSNFFSLLWIGLAENCMTKCKTRLAAKEKQDLQAKRQQQKAAKNNPYANGSVQNTAKKKQQKAKVPYQDPRKKKKK